MDDNLPHAKADASASELLPQVYDDLRRLARGMVAKNGVQTLTATALVHEAWLRVSKDDEPRWENRPHFFGAAAQAMRGILLNRARDKHRLKRGGNHEHVALDDVEIAAPAPEAELLALDQGIHHCLANHLERQVPLLAALHPAPVARARQLVLFRQRPRMHRHRPQRNRRDEILPGGDPQAVESVAPVHPLSARSEEARGMSAHSLYGSNFQNAALPSPRGSETLASFSPFLALWPQASKFWVLRVPQFTSTGHQNQ